VPGPEGPPGFRRFYDDHCDPIFAYLMYLTGDREEALDLLQETFVRAWSRLAQVAALGADQQRGWLRAVAHNAAVDCHRRRSARPAVLLEVTAEPSTSEPGLEEASEAAGELAAAAKAIAELPGTLREPLLLSTIGGLTSSAIGALLGLPSGTVRYRIAKARLELTHSVGTERQRRLPC
jgi:RNA polymerase sigma factor (sigma-70 family)